MEQKRTSEYVKIAELRTEADGKKLVVRGYPILFNTETRIYDYWYGEIRETIKPTALDNINLSDVYVLWGHDTNQVLGRSGINARFDKDDTGLFMELTMPNTQLARDSYNLIESGIIDGMSFGFTTSDEPIQQPDGSYLREINKIDELFEVSIVTFPAYKEASVVAQRNDLIQKQEEEKKQKELEEQNRQEELKKQQEQERNAKFEKLEAI